MNNWLSSHGLGADRIWLAGGRTGLTVVSHGGIEELLYWGHQASRGETLLRAEERSAYAPVIRPQLLVGERAYMLELNQTQVYPSGYRSTLELPAEGIEIEHFLVARNHDVLQTVRVVRNERNQPLRLRLSLHEASRVQRSGRQWGDWQTGSLDEAWISAIRDCPPEARESITWFGIVADKPLTSRLYHNGKRIFDTGAFTNGEATFATVFGFDEADFLNSCEELQGSASNQALQTISEWDEKICEAPSLQMASPAAVSFFQQAPALLEALMPTDIPGAMRASAGHYWVWGWDSMVYCDAYLAAGQWEFVKGALEFYRSTADPDQGIGHAFATDLTITNYQALPAQGLYLHLLYAYVTYTGDVDALRDYYPFARSIFDRTLAQDNREGLFAGQGLFPDYPQFAGHTGQDISTFNNSIFYQAVRCMEYLAGAVGDFETATRATECAHRLERAMRELCWDDERGYWVDSLDSQTLEPRRTYPSYALLWFSPFARDLVAGREERAAEFFIQHLACEGGLRMYPLWDSSFNADGNQMGQHYPVGSDAAFVKLITQTGNSAMQERWLHWIDQFWSTHTLPEGVTLEAENDGACRPDNPGCNQAFTTKAWYWALLHGFAGISFDAGGLTVDAGGIQEIAVEGLHFRGKRWNVSTLGSGPFVQKLEVNGREVLGTCKVPESSNCDDVEVHVWRGAQPTAWPQLLSADHATISDVAVGKGRLTIQLSSPCQTRIRFSSPTSPTITWQGRDMACQYDERRQAGSLILETTDNKIVQGELQIISH